MFPSVSLGLVRGENIEVKVLNLSGKQMVTSRGGADAVFRGEFVRIMQEGRYKGRAIAIQVLSDVTQWALYYQYEPISYAFPVTLKPSSPHQIPSEEKSVMNFIQMDTAFLQSYSPKVVQNKNIESNEDPEQKKIEAQYESAARYDESIAKDTTIKLENNLDDIIESESSYFDGFSGNVSVSPYSIQRLNNAKSIFYSVGLSSRGKNEASFYYSYNTDRQTDVFNNQVFSSSAYNASLTFDLNRLTENLTLFSFNTYQRQRFGGIYPIRMLVNTGPVGLKYRFLDTPIWMEKIDVSYVPVIDYRKSDVQFFDFDTFELKTRQETRTDIRHSFRFRVFTNFMESKLNINYLLFFRPLQKIKDKSISLNDSKFESNITVAYNLTQAISFSYQNILTKDITLTEISNIPATNMIQNISLNYSLEF